MLVLITEKHFLFFQKWFRFSENFSQSYSVENFPIFQWLSHENMPISQEDGSFQNL